MKYIICSDIHGATNNLNTLLAKVGKEIDDGKAKLVILGDLYNHGPRNPIPKDYAPMKVAEALNAHKGGIIAVRGNCDSEVDAMISEFRIYASCSTTIGEHGVLFTHGHKVNPNNPQNGMKKGDVVFYGHFHKPELKQIDGVNYVCVGALGIYPPDVKPSYAVLDEGKVTVYPLDSITPIFHFELN